MVDIHRSSPTFGAWDAFCLYEDNMRSIYCPVGFAHGSCVLSDVAVVAYVQAGQLPQRPDRARDRQRRPRRAIERSLAVDRGLRADASPVLT